MTRSAAGHPKSDPGREGGALVVLVTGGTPVALAGATTLLAVIAAGDLSLWSGHAQPRAAIPPLHDKAAQ